MFKRLLYSVILLFPATLFATTDTTFSSPRQQTTLLELYTSEGCSSCPPAERWLSHLKNHPHLWTTVVPIAFHVDYWDYLGWKDQYARATYTQRQRHYARLHQLRTLYTPGFMRNGKEWRNHYHRQHPDFALGNKVGILSVSLQGNRLNATFTPEIATPDTLTLNVAWLGFDLLTNVRAGENEGNQLRHDFVSLATQRHNAVKNGNGYTWQINTTVPANEDDNTKGIAIWVTQGNNPTPIQATGGWR